MANNQQVNPVLGWNKATIDQNLDQTSMKATQIITVTQQYKSLVEDFDSLQRALDKRLQDLKSVETKLLLKVQERPTRIKSIVDRDGLKEQVASFNKQIPIEKTALSDAENHFKKAQQEFDSVAQQVPEVNEEIDRIEEQINRNTAKLESRKKRLASVTQECDEKSTKAKALDVQVKLMKDALQTLNKEKSDIQKDLQDNDNQLITLEKDLSYTQGRYSDLQRKMTNNLKTLKDANESIYRRLSKRPKRS